MVAWVITSFLGRLPITVGPFVFWLGLNYLLFLKGMKPIQQLKGILLSAIVSYPVLNLMALVIYAGLATVLPDSLFSRSIIVAMMAAGIYTLAGLPLMLFYDRMMPKVCISKEYVSGNFCGFIYVEMLFCTYTMMVVASSAHGAFCWYFMLAGLWIFVLRKELDFLKMAYPMERINPSNVCVLFNYLVIVFLWVSPSALFKFVDDSVVNKVEKWISLFAVLIYLFAVVIHKIISTNLRHTLRENFFMNSDELTGLANRRYFLEKANEALETAKKNGFELACIYVDIVNFKFFNDNHGMASGDYVLEKVGRELMLQFGLAAGVGRLSDDHFAVLTNQVEEVEELIEQLQESLAQDEKCQEIRMGFGIYITNGSEESAEVAVERALRACKGIKPQENQFINYYDDQMDRRVNLEHYVVSHISDAIEKNRLQVYYQPIIDTSSKEICSAETLVRWFDDKHGLIGPDIFIPALEQVNQAYQVDQFVIRTVCEGMRINRDKGGPIYPASVNISRKDFAAVDMIGFLEKCVAEYGIDRNMLRIEITESAFVRDDGYVQKQVNVLRNLGYKVWMDDFGSGFSSLNAVAGYSFDGIKMDMVFLRNMNEKNCTLMAGVVKVAQELGISVLFEGVETEEQYEFVKSIGADKAQGYLFSKPKPMSVYLQEAEESREES